jgi:hypothetical protein
VVKLKKKVLIHKKTNKKTVKKVEKKVEKKLDRKVVARLPMKVPVKAVVTVSKPVAQPLVPVKAATIPAKPVIAPVVAKKRLLYVEVTPDKYFVLCDGRKIKSAKELAEVLPLITDDMFKYHVTDAKNDFSNWINDIFGEPELAKKIRVVKNKIETGLEIYKYMFDKLPK